MRLGARGIPAILLVIAACSTPPSTFESASLPAATASHSATAEATAVASPSPSASPPPTAERVLSWSGLNPGGSGPRAREDHTWTVDPATSQAFLFGGRDGARVLGDLWRYDLRADTWTRVTTEGKAPAPRFGHTGTWVPGVGLVVWSGQAGSDFFNDAWAYEPATGRWRRLPTNGAVPKARYGSCAALGPDGRLWISHGFTEDTGRFADSWAYDFTARRWFDETPTGKVATIRCLHDCLWTRDGRFLIYAGQTTGAPAIGDLWAREVEGDWTRIQDVPPPARQLYALAIGGAGQGTERAYIFGGGDEDRAKLADLWSLELNGLAWREETPTGRPPSARSGATMVADPSGSRLLLFGGQTTSGALDDLWELSLAG
jgi:Galactose oxidase, central domain